MVTIRLLSLSGRSTDLLPMPASTKLSDLAVRAQELWGIPVSAMKLLWGDEVLADLTRTLAEVFGTEEAVDLTVVRRQISNREQNDLNRRLLRAAACGKRAQAIELLQEGALAFAEMPLESGEEATDSKAAVALTEPAGCGELSPLLLAVAAGDEALARLLRAAGAPEPRLTPRTASMPEAFALDDVADVVRHLAAGADVNMQLSRGQGIEGTGSGAPLHAACAMSCFGTYELAQLLIHKKANVNKGDEEGDPPLAHAHYFRASAIKDLLKGHGARQKKTHSFNVRGSGIVGE